ncbi:MAG TPA: preprotein translocase subunit SecG [Alphaproteobacteria bacterium]|jgi:preprotein translocase subunit SecG|nr:preprotein translocase subunit SecG [Alphaproteobacteria bacterium]
MEIVLRVLQVFLAVGLIGVVLLQRSEGGGLGMGSGGGAGSFMSVRGTANFLTRLTAILAGLFMVTCLTLAILAKPTGAPKSIFDAPTPASAPVTAPPVETPAPQPAPAAEGPVLPVPVPGEAPNSGVTTNPLQPAPAPVAPAPAPAASAPAESAPAAPVQQPAEAPEKKAKKAKTHPSGQ